MTDQPHDSVAPPPPPRRSCRRRPPRSVRRPSPATTLASPPGMPAFHPRGILVANALARPLNRASWVAGITAALFVLVLVALLGACASTLLLPALRGDRRGRRRHARGVATMPVEVAARLRDLRLARVAGDRAASRRGPARRSPPSRRGAAVAGGNPRSSATASGRLELLAMLGRTDEAAAEQALLPPPATDAEAVEQALARFTCVHRDRHGRRLGARRPRGRLPRDTRAGLELLVGRAISEARGRLAQGGDDWRDPLLAVRPRWGRRQR